MEDGLLYIGLGAFWLLMVAVLGARKTLSTYIYTAIGCGGIIYGIVQIFKHATLAVIIGMTALITAVIVIALGIYIVKHRDRFPVKLTDDAVPELTAEEKFLRKAYKDNIDADKERDETPIL